MKLKELYFSAAMGAFTSGVCHAQAVEIKRDENNRRQIASIEFQEWNFGHRDWYYYLHKNYSGAKRSGLFGKVKFDEGKSNIKRMMWLRNDALVKQQQKRDMMKEEEKSIDNVYKEAVYQQADRMIDTYYPVYKESFNQLRTSITEGLIYCESKHKGLYRKSIDRLTDRAGMLSDGVKLISKNDILGEYSLASSNRREAYESLLSDYKKLNQDVYKLKRLIDTHVK